MSDIIAGVLIAYIAASSVIILYLWYRIRVLSHHVITLYETCMKYADVITSIQEWRKNTHQEIDKLLSAVGNMQRLIASFSDAFTKSKEQADQPSNEPSSKLKVK